MIKKIKVSHLRKGMFIHGLNCSWLKHPFAKNQFVLKSEIDIRKIIDAGIREIEIDTGKGLDVFVEKRKPENQILRTAIDEKKAAKPEKKVLKITAKDEEQQAKVAFAEAGFLINDMMADVKMGKQIEMEAVNPIMDQMSKSILRNENALLALTRIRIMNKYTFEHSVSLSVLLMTFAKSMKLSEKDIKDVGTGGLLHDIGKTLTPDHILNKPAKLTDEEFVIMRRHVEDSRDILNKTKNLPQAAIDVGALHHERYDGTGYPDGLKGDEISIYGRMAAIVDVYDAITANRCYHKGKEPSVVLKLLMQWSGGHFDPLLVQKFIQAVGIYPPGTLVLLNNGLLSKVMEADGNILKPIVECFFRVKDRSYITPEIINLAKSPMIKIASVESYAQWNLTP